MTMALDPSTHTVRGTYFEREQVWRLEPDAITCEGGGSTRAPAGVARFPYADVVELRLSFAPTRFDSQRHRCELRLADGRAATIVSTHFRAVGDFEDRSASYVPLVRSLVARVAAANPACRFEAGRPAAAYWGEHLFLLAMALLLALVLGFAADAALGTLVIVKLAIIACFVPLAVRYARKNRPRRFTPDAIPAEVLPAQQA